ncbi:SusC/RagA family TonB-linked outer membrane protein [Draconibacterium sediminis]|uniref:SusC/RagA family TonB-linked outer membrane protein n=1 Tax=Draconibacterium sediminis TaxID=1544798 RepID=UPI001E2A3363|nr:TonB-dependent receptor [Draconibacterium sediminis]
MKLTTFLIFVLTLNVFAESYAQSTKITLSMDKATVKEVIEQIESETEFYFMLKYDDHLMNRQVDIDFNDANIHDVLIQLFEANKYNYEIIDRYIAVTPLDATDANDQTTVKGIVTDEDGEALPGVTVLFKGTTNGTVTDINGYYELPVAEGKILVFSFVGMKSQEVRLEGQTKIDVTLEVDAIGIEEVVAIGYGVVKKSDLTGAVSSLKKDDMNTGVTATVDDLLLGKSAGVQITQASAEPGGGITIQIRGASSINAGSGPLYVIDGLPISAGSVVSGTGAEIANTRTPRNPLNDINPSDIESIEILKDASATAIYGARGANGVIIVTTKKGSAGKIRVTYNGYTGVQQSTKTVDVLNAQDYQRILNEILDTPGSNVSESERVTEIIDGGTNWQDELLRTGVVQSHALSFTGGNDATKYFASLNYFNQEGVIINSAFERYDARLNIDHKSGDFHFGANFATSYTHDDFLSYGYDTNEAAGVLYSAINFDPTLPIFGDDGRYMTSSLINTDNPLALANGEISKAENYRTFGTVFGEYTILPGWTTKLNIGFDTRNTRRDSYVTTDTKNGYASGGIGSILTGTQNNYLGELTSTYSGQFNENNQFTIMGGVTYQKFIGQNFAGTGKDFPADEALTYSMQSGNPELYSMSSGKNNNKLISYIGRINYNLYNKYLFTATFRADGSSRFGENNKFGYFPSGAFAWKMHEEDFIKDLEVFSILKFRASVGRTGNQAIGNYRSLTTFGKGPSVVLGDQILVSLEPERIANPDLKWETSEQINFGFDMGFFKNRIYASVDYFQKNTYDMLFAKPIPSSTGFGSILQNIGNIKNKGFEFVIDTKNLTGKFKWNTSFNLSTLKNEVVDLGGIPEIVHAGAGWTNQIAIIREGEALNSFYGYNVLGIWQSEEEIQASGTKDPVKPGDVRYEDVNGDDVVNSDDRVILGNSFPDLSYGLTNTFNYKRIGLNIFIDGVQGIDMLNNAVVETYFPISQRRNRLAEPYLNRWTADNPSTKYPSFVDPTNQGNKGVSSITVEDASFVRLRTVRLSYDIPIKNKKVFDRFNVYVSGQNLFVISDYSGVDPTTNSNGNASLKIDFNSYPVSRTFTVGVEIGL